MTTTLPSPTEKTFLQCKLCLTDTCACVATSAPVVIATKGDDASVMFARRGGAGDRLYVPTLDEWAAWKASVA